mgnify:CR=1 FL=1
MKTKKNGKTLRVAGLLLALVLVTSCFVGGTFAKYTTSDGGTDTARVAKFGVTVQGWGHEGTVFKKVYASDTASYTADTVISTEKVVAPGTKSEEGGILMTRVTGTPEVAVNVEYGAAVSLSGKWEYKANENAAPEFYCPLIIKVGETEIKGRECTSADDFATKVQNAIIALGGTYAAGTKLDDITELQTKISWEWPFEVKVGDNVDHTIDVKDTYLGNLAATATGNDVPTVSIHMSTTVTQID